MSGHQAQASSSSSWDASSAWSDSRPNSPGPHFPSSGPSSRILQPPMDGRQSPGMSPSPSNSSFRPVASRAALHAQLRNLPPVQHTSAIENIGGDAALNQPTTDIGILPDYTYDAYLPGPIGTIRRGLVWLLRQESPLLAWHQRKIRTPYLDRYFVYTSLLGTHSFFLIFLPMSFWLGNAYFARGLVNVLAFGVYFSSAAKDLLCVPRPYSPPVTRLTIGTHHLEYGFPSTHATNSISIASYVYIWVRALRSASTEPSALLDSRLWEISLAWYALSVVYGRLYAGMHSITDVVAGSTLGTLISLGQWYGFPVLEKFMIMEGWTVPAVAIPLGLLLVSTHPQPLDDCPCFEDAIAFIAVSMGVTLGRWANVRYALLPQHDNPLVAAPTSAFAKGFVRVTGSPLSDLVDPMLDLISAPLQSLSRVHDDASPLLRHSVYALKALAVMVLGILLIFSVRVVLKTVCKIFLPPTLRFFNDSLGLVLPRRHYTPANKYGSIPIVLDSMQDALPSVLDLPSALKEHQGAGAGAGNSNGSASSPGADDLRRSALRLPDSSSVESSRSPSRTTSPAFGSSSATTSGRRSPLPSTARHGNGNGNGNTNTNTNTNGILDPGEPSLPGERERERSTLRFTLHDGTPFPIPFTHPHQHGHAGPADERLAQRLAGAVSGEVKRRGEDEEERRRKETEILPPSNRKGDSAASVATEGSVKHYDADVLTKVIVYASIGFTASSSIPALFVRIGLM